MPDQPAPELIVARRVEARASCIYCPWGAAMRGDSTLEVVSFLQARLHEHIHEQHDGALLPASAVTQAIVDTLIRTAFR